MGICLLVMEFQNTKRKGFRDLLQAKKVALNAIALYGTKWLRGEI